MPAPRTAIITSADGPTTFIPAPLREKFRDCNAFAITTCWPRLGSCLPVRGGRAPQRVHDEGARIGLAKKAHATPPYRLRAVGGIIVRSNEDHRLVTALRLQLALQFQP